MFTIIIFHIIITSVVIFMILYVYYGIYVCKTSRVHKCCAHTSNAVVKVALCFAKIVTGYTFLKD